MITNFVNYTVLNIFRYDNMVKRLYRDTDKKIIAGVSAGLGDYFNIDPLIIRLIFIFTAFAIGTSIFIYIIMWALVPSKIRVIHENTYHR